MRTSWLVGLFFFPQLALASVQLSEIAWMGSADSANHEWIELYNSGAATSVDGWILHDANNLTIELTGTLPANQYVVLERTSDESAPGAAFLIYTGALPNVGATLVLRNAAGNVVDQVTGGEGWESVGGDNTTKDTAQRAGTVWRTAPPTPGRASNTSTAATVLIDPVADPVNASNSAAGTGSTATRRPTPVEQPLTLPDISLQLAIDAPTTVHVGQPVAFTAEPSGVGPTIAASLEYQWSLGNGEQRSGQDIEYTFTHPGQYVVVVRGAYKRQQQFTRQTVTVLPVELEVTKAPDGQTFILHNLSDHEIDIGGYTFAGMHERVFPTHTIILPQSQVRVPIPMVNRADTIVALRDETGLAVAVYVPGVLPIDQDFQLAFGDMVQPVASVGARAAAAPPPPDIPPTPPNPNPNFGFISEQPIQPATIQPLAQPPTIQPPPPTAVTPTPQLASAASAPNNPLTTNWTLYALIALLLLGTIGIYLVPQKKDDAPWV